MKKISILILLSMILCTVLNIFPATFAETSLEAINHDKAVKLKTLGLLSGSEKGFELERVPTRIEGAAMLVRLLGKEKLALAENYKHPFKDVPNWASPYVGYMYENKLTNGQSPSEFGTNDSMSASQYATFVLRSLGYDDTKGDFKWNESMNKIIEIGLIKEAEASDLNNREFLRGDLVNLSFNALKTKMKSSENTLINKLMIENSVPKDAHKLLDTAFVPENIIDEETGSVYSDTYSAKRVYEMEDKILLSSSEYFDVDYLHIQDKKTGVVDQIVPGMEAYLIKEYYNQIYFTSPNENWEMNIYRVNLDNSGKPEKVSDEPVRDFAIVDDYIYYVRWDYTNWKSLGLYVMDLFGKEIHAPLIKEPVWKFQVGNDGSLIYLTSDNTSYKNSSMVNSGTLMIYKNGKSNAIIDGQASSFQVYNDKIYYTNAGEQMNLYSVNLDGTDNHLVLENVGDFYLYDGMIYFSNEKDSVNIESGFASALIGKLYSADLDGTQLKKLTDSHAQSIIVTEGWVYFEQYFDSGMMNGALKMIVPIGGGEPEPAPYKGM